MDSLVVNRHLLPGLDAFRSRLGLPPMNNVFAGYLHSPQLVIGDRAPRRLVCPAPIN